MSTDLQIDFDQVSYSGTVFSSATPDLDVGVKVKGY
jgi:hypothetical protein